MLVVSAHLHDHQRFICHLLISAAGLDTIKTVFFTAFHVPFDCRWSRRPCDCKGRTTRMRQIRVLARAILHPLLAFLSVLKSSSCRSSPLYRNYGADSHMLCMIIGSLTTTLSSEDKHYVSAINIHIHFPDFDSTEAQPILVLNSLSSMCIDLVWQSFIIFFKLNILCFIENACTSTWCWVAD